MVKITLLPVLCTADLFGVVRNVPRLLPNIEEAN